MSNLKKSLKERAKEFSNLLPFMEGREKGDLKNLIGKTVTIREYGFMTDENQEEYVCFICDEDKKNFYFGGAVLTENMKDLDSEGYGEEIFNEGLPTLFGKKMSKSKREYTTIEFFPESK